LQQNNNLYEAELRPVVKNPPFRISHEVAMPAQHFGRNVIAGNLKGPDGMSKTTV